MRVDEQDQIRNVLESTEESLTFEEMRETTGLQAQDLRSALKELLRADGGVYVEGVEDREKYYDLR